MKTFTLAVFILIIAFNASANLLEKSDTIISINSQLELNFQFETHECGINILEHPDNAQLSELIYDNSLVNATYTYVPKQDFVGIDTVRFQTGCGTTPEKNTPVIEEFYIKVTAHEKVLYYYDEPKCSSFLQPYPSTDIFEIKAYIKQFFDNNGILVDSVDYSSVYNLYQDCESCGCLSGNRIYLRTADYYEESIKGYNFSTYAPLYHQEGYTRMSYMETQCSDPWKSDIGLSLIREETITLV